MKIKEFIQSITNRKSNLPVTTDGTVKNKNQIKFFICGAVIVSCSAFYQAGAKAQMQQDFLPQSAPPIATSGELIQAVPTNLNENMQFSTASRHIPSIYPVTGRLTDAFGSRTNPFGGKNSEFHPGFDIAAPTGTSVAATADGTVIFAGWQRGYGNVVMTDHGHGLTTRYGHLSKISALLGQSVVRGDEIGKVGSTGRATGAHLHYEVRLNNQPVNPADYLPLNK